jgi:ubiquitin carboxyl-terminal hydrolase 25/28
MIGSDKKYVDPTEVVKSISDDFGNLLPIGDQKDVGEFNNYFLSRVDEGLQSS